jgi:1-acyl-sn-glycerol-3-phosphate acyltransferase
MISFSRFCWRATITGVAWLLTGVLVSLSAVFAFLGDIPRFDWICRTWSRSVLRIAGARIEFEGLDNIQHLSSFVLVSNHQSQFDILAILGYFPRPVRFVAKKELNRVPVFGAGMRNGGHIVVDRERGGHAVRKAMEVLREGYCVVFFAEGHRFKDGRVHPFNPGAAWLALLTKLPCVPLAIDGTANLMPNGSGLFVRGQAVHISVGSPIATAHLRASDRNQLTRRLEQAVRDLLPGEREHGELAGSAR